MKYTTADIWNIVQEHEAQKYDPVPRDLKPRVNNALLTWYKVTSGQWEDEEERPYEPFRELTDEAKEYLKSFNLDIRLISNVGYNEEGYFSFLRTASGGRYLNERESEKVWCKWPAGFDVSKIEFELDNTTKTP